MTEQESNSVEILNKLHAAEMQSILCRLPGLGAFVPGTGLKQHEAVQRACSMSGEHRAWLVEAIERMGGAVWPATMDPRTASLHYVSIGSLLPQVRTSVNGLAALYAEAGKRGPLTAGAAALISRIAGRYQELAGSLGFTPAATATR